MTVPEGPTDPRLSVAPVEENTTIVTQSGYGPPAWAPPPSEPTLDRPPAEQPPADRPPGGRVYAAEQSRVPATAPPGAGRGRTTIADEVVERVIERIVTLAVDQAAGVRALHSGEDEPISVRLADGNAEITISLQVEFGHAVHEAVEQLRAEVVSQTERQLGLTVDEVNVLVADVVFDQPD